MPSQITTQFGYAAPPGDRHAVTVHLPKWQAAADFAKDTRSFMMSLYNAYPRMKPHRDIVQLSAAVLALLQRTGDTCLLFVSLQSAKECVEYCTDQRRTDPSIGKQPVPKDQMEIRAFQAKDKFFAVLFPAPHMMVAGAFWLIPGVGMSSRCAEANLLHLDNLCEVALEADQRVQMSEFDDPAYEIVRQRIVDLLKRAPILLDTEAYPASSDVYLFPTGMASIYRPHVFMNADCPGTTILFGMAFANTVGLFQEFGGPHRFFGIGTDTDLAALEVFLESENQAGRSIQAIWTEFPANPILVTPDLVRLRYLADKYDAVLAVDDTLGGYANVDIIAVTDILVTSLTKSFNGYADVIAGSAVLNPAGKKYSMLKPLFEKYYEPELCHLDVKALERNSRDYLERVTKLNSNTMALVSYLQSCARDPSSSVHKVHHPSINPCGSLYYKPFMRPATEEFTPGYTSLFSVEFEDDTTAAAFYDNLAVHCGPHIGAQITLAFIYVMFIYGTKLDWASQYGLKPAQIRISAGLEDEEDLLQVFKDAVQCADEVKLKRTQSDGKITADGAS